MLKKIIYTSLIILAIIAITIGVYLFKQTPSYQGNVVLKELNTGVNCYFDDYGIPHIEANSEADAMQVLGYMHAKERLWQMELMRRLAPGRLSEILGEDTLEVDAFFAHLGIEEHNLKLAQNIQKNNNIYPLIQAYLSGVNQYINTENRPIELHLLGVNPKPFELIDILNIYGYMAFSFSQSQKVDALLTEIHQNLGPAYLEDFGLDHRFFTTKIGDDALAYTKTAHQIHKILHQSPVTEFVGSNSWVLGPNKTKNKAVILANDPHIMFSQPGTWYEAHLLTPTYEIYGYYVPGTPFPLLAHNREFAMGLTMFQNDDSDFFDINFINNNQYTFGDSVATVEVYEKEIKIKGKPSKFIERKVTQLGPIISGVNPFSYLKKPLAMRWTYLEKEHDMIGALYGLSRANNIEKYLASVAKIAAPGLNVMYGDAQGNIAWTAAAHLYRVPDSISTYQVLNASNPKHLIKTEVPFEQNPKSINPPKGYVYSANNLSVNTQGEHFPGYYLPNDRAQRIIDLLDAKNDWTLEEVAKMMLDDQSDAAKANAHFMVNIIKEEPLSFSQKEIIQIINQWQGSHNITDIAPAIYNKWIYFYLKNTFEDELGKEAFELFLQTHTMKQMLGHQLKNTKSPWWDNTHTKNKTETQTEILYQSFLQAFETLENQLGKNIQDWQWGKVHQLELKHPFAKNKLFSKLFNVGNSPIAASNEVINNLMFTYSNEALHQIKAGPSTRRAVDFSDVERSVSVLPSGQSGHFLSKHYKDQHELFVEGKYRPMLMNIQTIKKLPNSIQFKPL